MRLQLISDLHTEFYRKPLAFCENGVPLEPNLDFLVLAGDIVVPKRMKPGEARAVLEYFAPKARHVLYVEGNHEFYGGDYRIVTEMLREIMPSNYVWLQNRDVTLDGVHFYGGTMWFPDDRFNQLFEHEISDFSQIHGYTGWFYHQNTEFRSNAQKLVTKDTIVISHHLPHPKSTPERFANSNINRFFVSDETALIADKQPRLWFHGHTHDECDYWLGDTHVVCNPWGYLQERLQKNLYPIVAFDV
jgi:predicted phosphodiesterase